MRTADVIHHAHRSSSEADEIIHVHRDAVDTDGVVLVHQFSYDYFGAHTVGAEGDSLAISQVDDVGEVADIGFQRVAFAELPRRQNA